MLLRVLRQKNTWPDINLENVLLEFLGMPAILTKCEVSKTLKIGGNSGKVDRTYD